MHTQEYHGVQLHLTAALLRLGSHALFAPTQLSINFGHELVTSVHTPIAWSDKRPTDEEFRTSFGATRLSSQRLLQFVRRRAHCIRRLVLQNSEGYWCGEYRHRNPSHNGGFKHDVEPGVPGVWPHTRLGILSSRLTAMQMMRTSSVWLRSTTSRPPTLGCCSGCCTAWKVLSSAHSLQQPA